MFPSTLKCRNIGFFLFMVDLQICKILTCSSSSILAVNTYKDGFVKIQHTFEFFWQKFLSSFEKILQQLLLIIMLIYKFWATNLKTIWLLGVLHKCIIKVRLNLGHLITKIFVWITFHLFDKNKKIVLPKI